MSIATMVRTENLSRRFGAHDVLRGLDLAVPEGAAYALIGANGAGKTTTIKLLMNMLAPSAGSATVMGVDTRRLTPETLAQIGYVSENQTMPARMTVGDYIDYLRPFYPAWDRVLEASTRKRLQLPPERKIGALSHGMRIKLALACALPYRPRLLVLDEPFSGLDPLVREEFMEGLLLESDEMTMLISSHELGEIENLATHVGFIDAGQMLVEESMDGLGERIRDVRITFEHATVVPNGLPKEWLKVRAVGNVLSFVDTRYSESGFGERVGALFGPVRRIDVQAMPLRAVFTTLARAARDGDIR